MIDAQSELGGTGYQPVRAGNLHGWNGQPARCGGQLARRPALTLLPRRSTAKTGPPAPRLVRHSPKGDGGSLWAKAGQTWSSQAQASSSMVKRRQPWSRGFMKKKIPYFFYMTTTDTIAIRTMVVPAQAAQGYGIGCHRNPPCPATRPPACHSPKGDGGSRWRRRDGLRTFRAPNASHLAPHWQVALPLRSESNLSTPKNTLPHPIFIKPSSSKNHQPRRLSGSIYSEI